MFYLDLPNNFLFACLTSLQIYPDDVVGFRLDPADKLERVHQELSSLHQVHAADPILGVNFEEEESVSNAGKGFTSSCASNGSDYYQHLYSTFIADCW